MQDAADVRAIVAALLGGAHSGLAGNAARPAALHATRRALPATSAVDGETGGYLVCAGGGWRAAAAAQAWPGWCWCAPDRRRGRRCRCRGSRIAPPSSDQAAAPIAKAQPEGHSAAIAIAGYAVERDQAAAEDQAKAAEAAGLDNGSAGGAALPPSRPCRPEALDTTAQRETPSSTAICCARTDSTPRRRSSVVRTTDQRCAALAGLAAAGIAAASAPTSPAAAAAGSASGMPD
jgi:hypothetical protein